MPNAVNGIKRCRVCKESKPVSAFNRNGYRSDGVQPFCRPCHNAKVKEYRKTPSGRAKHIQSTNAAQKRNKIAKQAHNAVFQAIKKGIIVRPGYCERCGATCKPEGHHEDYSQQLTVVWLCHACHTAVSPRKVKYA
jgi:hypothetical protein